MFLFNCMTTPREIYFAPGVVDKSREIRIGLKARKMKKSSSQPKPIPRKKQATAQYRMCGCCEQFHPMSNLHLVEIRKPNSNVSEEELYCSDCTKEYADNWIKSKREKNALGNSGFIPSKTEGDELDLSPTQDIDD